MSNIKLFENRQVRNQSSHRDAMPVFIAPEWKEKLYKYITGIIQNYDHSY